MSLQPQAVDPPQGTVTLLFTDVQGSTAGWERYADTFGEALQIHEAKLRASIEAGNGFIVKTVGDAFMAAFASAMDAVAAAVDMQRSLAVGDPGDAWKTVGGIRIRIGLHTGEPAFRDRDYFGPPVNRAARISDAGQGGMILLSEATLRAAGLSPEPHLKIIDHGYHRLKDLGDPEHLFELRADDLPPPADERLRTLESRQHNFPAQATALVGRQRELAELHALISRRQSRLITLTGPGGTGKTRLALQVAVDRVQDFPGGVWLVELAGTYDPAAVPAAIAAALQLEHPPGADAKSVVTSYLRPRRSLLVLDNYEQVADAARVVSELLRDCGDLVCLVTSRELLRVGGEFEYPVEPLSIPPADAPQQAIRSSESVQLFVDRCQASRGDFELTDENAGVIAEICRRLDGIPLAIELAAARTRGMTPAQVLQRMGRMFDLLASGHRDLPERQKTLRSAIDWSFQLLSEEEREAFSELAVFAGGFTLDAAEAICVSPDAFDSAFSLRDKSLLKTTEVLGESRFSMLSTIREYATEKLKQREVVKEVHDRHLRYYQERAAEWSARLAGAGSDAPDAMRIFTVELDNIRAGMDWAAQSGDYSATVEYAKGLFAFLRRRGLYDECDIRLTLGEQAARDNSDEVSLARLLNQRALVAYDLSDVARARPLFQESYTISKKLTDRPRMMVSLMNLGNISWTTSRFADARREWEEALELATEAGQVRYEAFLQENLGILDCQEGLVEQADQHFQASLRLHKKVQNSEGLASSLYNSSDVYRMRGEHDEALRRVIEARALYTSLQDQRGLALTAVRAGMIERERGNIQAAQGYISEGLQIAETTGNRHPQMFALLEQARLAVLARETETAETLLRQSFEIGRDVGDHKHIAEVTAVLAVLRSIQQRQVEATSLYARAIGLYERLGLVSASAAAEFTRQGMDPPAVAQEAPEPAEIPDAEWLFGR